MGDQSHSFVFINKNASNLSSKAHIKRATSHAQYVTWQHRHKGKLRNPKKRSQIIEVPLKEAEPEEVLAEAKDGSAEDFQLVAKINLDTTHTFPPIDPLSDMILLEQIDPFMTFPVEVTQHERNLLQFCTNSAIQTSSQIAINPSQISK